MQEGRGLLAVWMDPGQGINEDEFNEWYNKEHVPERLGIQGVLSANRFSSLQGIPRYIALYELTSIDVLSSDDYLSVRRAVTPWTRRIGRNLERNLRYEYELLETIGPQSAEPSPYLMLARYNLGGEKLPGSSTESDAAQLSLPGIGRVRHYWTPSGEPKYLSVFEMEDPDVSAKDDWKRLITDGGAIADVEINVAVPIEID